jgi:hypothetical protein
MTDQFTSLTPSAIREILAHIDESLAVFEKNKGRISITDLRIKSMLTTLRAQLNEQLDNRTGSGL